jgi:nicotinamidase-related amidase
MEDSMLDRNRPYEPLTAKNAAFVLVDHQVGLMTGVRDYSTGELKHNVVALAKAADALKLPIVPTAAWCHAPLNFPDSRLEPTTSGFAVFNFSLAGSRNGGRIPAECC